ncbi:NfeD family protein [Chthonobacter rhizosphaerae]|uniref:NfeD family protein n=1 Tax=Chthonobacter rhizosphaerae TaxID=2735553 RepID=UPI0015EF26F8|nr:NfeD family protein [Chthonobacter rhizosphaerae]
MLRELVVQLGPWLWWVLGILLAAVEVFAPGSFFIWFAVAAIIVGGIALTVDLGWQAEILLFVVFAGLSALLGRRLYGRNGPAEDAPPLNDRMRRQVGRPAVLETALANGSGHIRLDDTLWRVSGPDLPAGTTVTVVDVRDGRLVVAPR